MTIVRYQPYGLVNRFHRDVFSAFDRFFGDDVQAPANAANGNATKQVAWLPAVDVREEEGRFVVQVDLPGVESKDIEITAEKGVLTIKGERASVGTFLRRFSLPESAQTDAISAKQANGVLEVSIPKQAPVQAKRIEVQAA
jgi:HSP20 family protein